MTPRTVASAALLLASTVMLCGCLAVGAVGAVGGAAVGVAGAAAGVSAKAIGAAARGAGDVAGAVIPSGKKDDKAGN